jgi:hypothetical protein
MKKVRISTRNVGQSFGTQGVILALNGRVLASTDTKPYGFHAAARAAAEQLAERLGYVEQKTEAT